MLSEEIRTCCQAVFSAGQFTKKIHEAYNLSSATTFKEDASPVTLADLGAQAIIHASLKTYSPNDQMIAEETSSTLNEFKEISVFLQLLSQSLGYPVTLTDVSEFIDWGNVTKPCNDGESGGRLWTLDPIDGTLGYLRDEQYSICLAKFNKEKTDIELSFLYCPNLSQILPDLQSTSGNHGIPLYFSQKGLGAYLIFKGNCDDFSDARFVRLSTQKMTSVKDLLFCVSVESRHSSQYMQSKLFEMLDIKKDLLKVDSQCKYGLVAHGIASAYLRWPISNTYEEKIWDHAPGYLMVKEAGGCVTDLDGKDLDFSLGKLLSQNRGILATCNPIIHNLLLDAIQKI